MIVPNNTIHPGVRRSFYAPRPCLPVASLITIEPPESQLGFRGADDRHETKDRTRPPPMPQHLALLGGRPVRKHPFTAWPIVGEREEARLLGALRSGHWGRLDGNEVTEFEERFAAMHGCQHGIA